MEWDEHASGWDSDPAVRAYAAAAFGTLTALLAQRDLRLDGMRVLDFGCGTGLLTEALAAHCGRVTGLDPSPKMIRGLVDKIEANGWAHVHAVLGTIGDIRTDPNDALDGPFDLIVCSSVCAFVPDYPGTTAQLARLLGPGGVFMQFDWERDDSEAEPFGLTTAEITAALTGAGLTALTVKPAFEQAVGEHTMRPLVGLGRRASSSPPPGAGS